MRLALLFLLAASIVAHVHAETLQEKLDREKAAMDSLNTALENDRKVLSQTARRKVSTGTQLDRLQQEGVRTKQELRSLAARERGLQLRVQQSRQALSTAERKLVHHQDGIGDRLRTAYKLSRKDPLTVLLSGASLSEGVRRLTYLSKVAQQDRVDLATLASAKMTVQKNLKLRQIQYAHQQALVQTTRKKERNLSSSVSDYNRKLRSLKRQETVLKSVISENNERLAESQNRIGEIIKEIERQRLAGRRLAVLPDFDFVGKQGALPWPVRGKVLSRFGRVQDPELGTWTMNRGVSIAADAGTDVLVIAPGEVVLVDWWRGYGQLVLMRHPDGYYTLYGHLESRSVEVGEILNEGALIGTVGNTGRLDGVAQLHFEIMKEEEALNPISWLVP
jgi:murein hydrolase activator